jgi:hypothetical protein
LVEAPLPAEDPFAETALPAQTGSNSIAPTATASAGDEAIIPPPAPETRLRDGAPVMEVQAAANAPSAMRTAGVARSDDSAMQAVAVTARPVITTGASPASRGTPAPEAAGEAPATKATGNWVINIASYTNENIARRKLADMQQQAIDVELVTAEVNGKTVYRARVFGFETRQAARAQAAVIKQKLGLKETWIARR